MGQIADRMRAQAAQLLADAPAVAALEDAAPPAPAPVPTPPTPAPAPPAPGLLTVTTNGHTLQDPSRPPVITDTIDPSRGMPPVPWSLFRDPAQHVAWPLRGAEPDHWRRLPIYGYPAEYSVTTPAIVGGKLEMLYPASVNDADPALLIVPHTRDFPVRGGARGEAITTPYWLVRGHTRYGDDGTLHTDQRIPAWVAVDMVGRLYYLMRDGSVQIVATIPLKTYANDFSYFDLSRKDMFVTDTGAGEVLKVHRDGATFAPQVWAKVPGRATSCRVVGSTLYVANEAHVWAFDAFDANASGRIVCALPGVFWIDYLSDGRLVVMARNSAIHVVDPATGNVGPDINGRDAVTGADYHNATPVGWVMVEVDRAGTCGPKDSIYACASHSLAINGPWRIAPDGRITRIPGIAGAGRSLAGKSTTTIEGGHYMWAIAVHPDEGMLLIQGGAQILPVVYAAIGASDTSWPAEDNYNHAWAARGYQVIRQGSSSADRAQQMPLSASMGASGNSFVGVSPDHIASMSFDEALAFIRGGMLSTTPRKIDDADALPVLYWMLRASQRFLREGKAAIDALRAWADSK